VCVVSRIARSSFSFGGRGGGIIPSSDDETCVMADEDGLECETPHA
jgi:hypothetical protein